MECKTTPIISIIVPVFNVEQYLHRCVDSILAQTFTDFELILVDDGSPDGCPAICDEYAALDPRVFVIHQKNGGVSAARNSGLDVARGEYIAFCDGDDHLAPAFLERLLSEAMNQNADCVISNYLAVDDADHIFRRSSFEVSSEKLITTKKRWEYLIHDVLVYKHGWEVCTRLFRAAIIQNHHIRFCLTCENFAEDLGFSLEFCLYATKIVCIEDPVYFYVVHNGSMMDKSKNVIKLSQLNEISAYFWKKYAAIFGESKYAKLYPILHFLIMRNQYSKLIGTERYSHIREEIKKIKQKTWYRKQVKGIFRCAEPLKELYGRKATQQILLFSHYCLHGNWKRFYYESGIAYRFFIKDE